MKTERELITEAQDAMGTLKALLGRIAKINKDAGRDEIWLVTTKRLRQLEVLHADMGLDLLKYMPDVDVRGPGR
ncbi:MAG: hypothetical protein ACRC14_02665 [Paracoccaceae bacterium]